MSDERGVDLLSSGSRERPPSPGRRRAEKTPRDGSLLRRIIALAVVAALVFGAVWAYQKVTSFFAEAEDYSGAGSGSVTVEVTEGVTGQELATTLAEKDVVASAEAFHQLSLSDARWAEVQPGFFELAEKMSSDAALSALIDPANRVEESVTVPEGARIDQVIEAVAANSEITAEEVTAVLESPGEIDLPDAAQGNPEGYLYPATYSVQPGTTAVELISEMVATTVEVGEKLDIEARAEELGYSTEEILTLASILEYEAKADEDLPKVARVFYNRLDEGIPLQSDATVSYVSGREGDVWTTEEERDAESAYNTYDVTGLPPGPIGSPGERTIEAALNPAEGDWLYFVAVNPVTGETKYAETLAEHEVNAEEARQFCRESDAC